MISTAKNQNYIRKLQQYEVAVSNFHLNFKSIPGDDTYFDPPGDGNGILDSSCHGIYYGEQWQVWAHLSESGMLKDTYTPFQSAWCGGVGVDYFSMGGIVAPDFSDTGPATSFFTGTLTTVKKTTLLYGDNGTTVTYQFFIPAIDALAIDAKMDDGNLATGNITDGGAYGGNNDIITWHPAQIAYH